MIPPTRRFSRYRNAWLSAGLVMASLFAGCSGDEKKEEGGAASACLSDRAFFESKVWASFMSEKCARCHTPDGEAVNEKGAKLVLQTSSYPSFLDANLESLRQASNEKFGDKIKLLEKPLGGLDHGGGPVLEPGGPEHQALQELVRRVPERRSLPGREGGVHRRGRAAEQRGDGEEGGDRPGGAATDRGGGGERQGRRVAGCLPGQADDGGDVLRADPGDLQRSVADGSLPLVQRGGDRLHGHEGHVPVACAVPQRPGAGVQLAGSPKDQSCPSPRNR
jgi:cytochrome c553